MIKLNKYQKELVKRTQKYYDDLSKKDRFKHEKMLKENYLNSKSEYFIQCYEYFSEKNNIKLPKKI